MKILAAILLFMGVTALPLSAHAAATGCGQAVVERLLGAPPPPGPSPFYILPREEITPFYQWESNNGYCGEVSLMSAGLINGQWMSQYNARLVCGAFFGPESNRGGASLLQAGNPPGNAPNYNSQLLIEAPNTGVSGEYDFAYAARCGSNARLLTITYPYRTGYRSANSGMAGYRDYMRWIKAQVIVGNQVTAALLYSGGDDPQYDHEVSVLKIGTTHANDDASYYDDDVLYFEDHGVYTLTHVDGRWAFAWNPSVPYGSGKDTIGCTPYVFAYRFGDMARTRETANADGAPAYSIIIPGDRPIDVESGNTGLRGEAAVSIQGPHNYAFAVAGPIDEDGETKPVRMKIVETRSIRGGIWHEDPYDGQSSPPAGYGYETPYIGSPAPACNQDDCVSNLQPPAMLMTLEATVSGLREGTEYNLYEYDLPSLTGAATGTAAALSVPTRAFNRNHAMATSVTRFTASRSAYAVRLNDVPSDRVVVFRAVPATAP